MITPQRIRLALNMADPDTVVDKITGGAPEAYRATDIQFEFCLFYGDELQDVSNITSITLQIKPLASKTSAALIEKTISSVDNTVTDSTWAAGTAQHGLIAITDAESALNLNGLDSVDYWLLIKALTMAGADTVLCACVFRLKEAGIAATAAPPLGDPTYLTAAECDARYQLRTKTVLYVPHENGLQWIPMEIVGGAGAYREHFGDAIPAQNALDVLAPHSNGTQWVPILVEGAAGAYRLKFGDAQ